MSRRPEGDTGSALPLVAAATLLAAACAMGVTAVGGAVIDQVQASTAADAAALAALDGGESGAARLAWAHGARIVVCRCTGDPVEVVVTVGRARATARASRLP